MRAAWVAAAAALLLAGCGGDDEKRPNEEPRGLAGALKRAAVDDRPPAYIEWSDMAALRKLADLPESSAYLDEADPSNPWAGSWGLGAIRLANNAATVVEATGIDILEADELLTIGEGREAATVLRGDRLAVETVIDRYEAAGAKETEVADRTFLAIGEEGEIDINSPFADLGLLAELNHLLTGDGLIAFGSRAEPVARAVGAGDGSVLDLPGRRDAVECLGGVIAAMLVGEEPLVAVGVRRDAREVVCVVGDDPVATERALARGLRPGAVSRVTGEPLDIIVGSGTDRVGDRAARAIVTLQDGYSPGFVFEALGHGDLPVRVDEQ